VCTPLPDPLHVHEPKDRGGMGLPDPLNLFDSKPTPMPGAPAELQPSAPPPTQSSKLPDQSAMRRALQVLAAGASSAGLNVGKNNTMLTGPGGVSPNLLSLGRNTLLGS
jgi:hypothetical protein